MTSQIKAVVFDMYHTVLEVVRPMFHHHALAEALRVPVDAVKMHDDEFSYAFEIGRISHRARMSEICRRLGVRVPTGGEMEMLIHLEIEGCVAPTRLYDGVPGLLARLRQQGYLLGLCSNANPIGVTTARHLGLLDRLDGAAFSCRVGAIKPQPDMYEEVCRQLEVEPEDCLYVDDGGSLSIMGARRMGMTTVLVRHPGGYGGNHPDEYLEEHQSIGKVTDIMTILPNPARI